MAAASAGTASSSTWLSRIRSSWLTFTTLAPPAHRRAERFARQIDDDWSSVRRKVGGEASVEVGREHGVESRAGKHGKGRVDALDEHGAIELIDLVSGQNGRMHLADSLALP